MRTGDAVGECGGLILPTGFAERAGDGAVRWLTSDGRLAAAGDGVAAAIWDAMRRSDGRPEPLAPGGSRESAIAVDQTNWSVVVDDAVVVKAVLKAGAADRASSLLPLLSGAGIAPDLLGVLRFEDGAVAALAFEFVRGAQDGWTWAIEDVLAWRLHHEHGDPRWPAAVGVLVARMHAALARDAQPVAMRAEALRSLAAASLDAAYSSCLGTPTATRLRLRRELLLAELDALPAEQELPGFGLHGDLHVGQLLRRPDADPADPSAYRVIDFDGDPQATEEERDSPAPATVDLGHLLVSVDLVVAVVHQRIGAVDPVVAAWGTRARTDLLDAYAGELARRGRTDLLGDPAHLPAFLAAAEVQQLARELIYAARYLPRWRYAPDGAIAARHPLPDRKDDIPWTPPASPTTSD